MQQPPLSDFHKSHFNHSFQTTHIHRIADKTEAQKERGKELSKPLCL